MKTTMTRLLFILALSLSADAAVVTFNNLNAFTDALSPDAVVSEPVNETQILVFTPTNQFTFSTGFPLTGIGVTVDTRPNGPGTGLEFLLDFGGVLTSVGFFGGNGLNVIGFFGFTSDTPFDALVIRTGDPRVRTGIQETVTVGSLYYAAEEIPCDVETPEPGTMAYVGIPLLLFGMLSRRRRHFQVN